MHNSIQHYPRCDGCTFSPFCIMTHKHRSFAHPYPAIVKKHRILKRHDMLYLAKNKFHSLFIIQEGIIKTYQLDPDGKELIRGFYFASEAIGYEAICTGEYLFSAVAISDVAVCEIPYERVLELLHTKPALQKRFLHLISRQLNIGFYLAAEHAEQRLASFLLDIAARLYPLENKLEFKLPMSRQDIGNYLRLTAETVSRVFSRFQTHQIIIVKNKNVCFIQLDALKQIAEGMKYP